MKFKLVEEFSDMSVADKQAEELQQAMDQLCDYLDNWYNDNIAEKCTAAIDKANWDNQSYLIFRNMLSDLGEGLTESTEIEVENPGLLEVPKDKKVDELPPSHFEKLVDKKGYSTIIKGLNNLVVWNKNNDKQLSSWAKDMMEKLKKKYRKNEVLNEDEFDKNSII